MFLLVCKQADLDFIDMDEMTIGMCLDYVEEYVEIHDPKRSKSRSRRATQVDYDSF